MIETGGPAFPELDAYVSRDGSDPVYITNGGMSLRDWFAGQALAGFCANHNAVPHEQSHFDSLAADAYRTADAMLRERAK